MTDDAVAPPSRTRLEALDADSWAAVLPHARAVLASAADDPGARRELDELRAAPVSRLAGGRLRRQLAGMLADGTLPWGPVAEALSERDDLPAAVAALLSGARSDQETSPTVGGAAAGEELRRLRERLRRVRDERDEWRRRAQGSHTRAERLEVELEGLRTALVALEEERDHLAGELAAAHDERRRAVGREARRQAAAVRQLEQELTAVRREHDEHRLAQRRAEQAELRRTRQARRRDDEQREEAQARRGEPRVVPGRPTRLPDTVHPGTTEAARLLLHRGRRVLVDGYNVTRQHRGHLDLERQRTWLVGYLATLVAQRGIDPVVVFDGEQAGGTRGGAARDVEVRFTSAGITADDELVLEVEATDVPVVVVTDDRELVGRVTAAGADTLPTRAFLGVSA